MQIAALGSWVERSLPRITQRLRRVPLAVTTLLAVCAPGFAQAADSGAPTLDVSACDSQSRERLQWLVERMDSREFYGDLWWRGWLAIYGTGAVVQGVRAGLENDGGHRADYIVSSVKAVGGVARLLYYRPVVRLGADPLRAEPLPDEAACRARVEQGETLLKQAAKESQQRWSWKGHAFNVGVNLLGGLIVSQAFNQDSGWISAGVGIAVGEAMLWSHPWHGKSDLEEYDARFTHASAPQPSWALVPYRQGLLLQVRF